MQFVVRYLGAGASAVSEARLEAESAEALRTRLTRDGAVVLGVRQSGASAQPQRAGAFDVAWWCRELETLLRAGMTAVEALETLASDRQDVRRRQIHESLLRSLHEGAALSKAMRAAQVFPEVLVAGVTASERTSTLPDALQEYLRYDELLQRLRRQAVSAALYPALVVALGALISLFLLLYVIPRFSRMYTDMPHALSTSTQVVLWFSGLLRNHAPLLLAAVVVLGAAALVVWRSGGLATLGARLIDWVLPLRRQWDEFRLAKLYQSLALLVRGGYNFDEALQVCATLSLGSRMSAGVELAREHIARGKPASAAMASAGLTDTTTQRLLVVGERTGAFATVLQTIAERHASTFTTFVERATRVLEPLLLLATALIVGGLVVMMYMPIFDIAGGIGAGR